MEQNNQQKEDAAKQAACELLRKGTLKLKHENEGYDISHARNITSLLDAIDFRTLKNEEREIIEENVVQIASDFLLGNIENNTTREQSRRVNDQSNREIVGRYRNASEIHAWVKKNNLSISDRIEDSIVSKVIEDVQWLGKMNDQTLLDHTYSRGIERDDTELRILFSLMKYVDGLEGKRAIERAIDIVEARVTARPMEDIRRNIADHIVTATSMEERESLMLKDWFNDDMDAAIAIDREDIVTGKNKDGEYYFHLKDDEKNTWLIQNYYMMSFSPTVDIRNVALVKENNRNVIFNMSTRDFLDCLDTKDKLKKVLQSAEDNNKSEENETVKLFDLPRDEAFSYLRIFPQQIDTVMSSLTHGSTMKVRVLQDKYKKIVPERIIEQNPLPALKEKIRSQYDRGNRFFMLDFYSHGSDTELVSFEPPVRFSDVEDIVKEYPMAHFHIETVACHGGGFITPAIVKRLKESGLDKRLTVITQTKNAVVNPIALVGYGDQKNTMYSSYYQIRMLWNILRGDTYGAAHLDADRHTKTFERIDPEGIFHGDYISEVLPSSDVDNVSTAS